MDGFLTPDNPDNLFLPQLEKTIAALKLPLTHQYKFRLLEEMTGSGDTISDSTLYKLSKGEKPGKNVSGKLDNLYSEVIQIYQVTSATSNIVESSLKVRSNATDWLYFLDGFTQSQNHITWPNTIDFIRKRCSQDIEFFEVLKSKTDENSRLDLYANHLKKDSLIPQHLIETFFDIVASRNGAPKKQLCPSATSDLLLFNFHLRADFLFSLAAHFERDLDLPHYQINPDFEPQSRVGQSINCFIDENLSDHRGYRNLFGCFLDWFRKNISKKDGATLTWSDLAGCISMPGDDSDSGDRLDTRQYQELRKWRKAKTKKHRPGDRKLLEFVFNLFGHETKNGQASVVYLILKYMILLDELVLDWQKIIKRAQSESISHNKLDDFVLIASVLSQYNKHWLTTSPK